MVLKSLDGFKKLGAREALALKKLALKTGSEKDEESSFDRTGQDAEGTTLGGLWESHHFTTILKVTFFQVEAL